MDASGVGHCTILYESPRQLRSYRGPVGRLHGGTSATPTSSSNDQMSNTVVQRVTAMECHVSARLSSVGLESFHRFRKNLKICINTFSYRPFQSFFRLASHHVVHTAAPSSGWQHNCLCH